MYFISLLLVVHALQLVQALQGVVDVRNKAAAPSTFVTTPIQGYNGLPPQVLTCQTTGPFAPGQRWTVNGTSVVTVSYMAPGPAQRCLTIPTVFVPDMNGTVVVSSCSQPLGSDPTQTFTFAGGVLASIAAPRQCMDIDAIGNNGIAVGQVVFANCTGSATQQWVYNASTQQMQSVGAPGMCVDASTVWRPCSLAPANTFTFCNASVDMPTRVADALARMTPNEKANQLLSDAGPVPSLALSPWTLSDFTHSVSGLPGITWGTLAAGGTVVYPAASHTAAAFNATLFRVLGSRIGDEARSLYNTGLGALIGWSPNINVLRDPRWGRANEVTGEDPYLMGVYARELVTGQQWGLDAPPGVGYLKTVATCKHFDAYSLELWNGTIRYDFNAIVPMRDLVGTYLPAFQACVQEAAGAGLMCSYNAINGTPSCANDFLMNQVARGMWGFDGYITSDCGAAKAVYITYNYVDSYEATCPVTLRSGMDMGCNNDGVPLQCAAAAIRDGLITEGDVDTAVSHILRVRMRTGEFDPPSIQPYTLLDNNTLICTPDGYALAQSAAEQAMILVKANASALPLAAGVQSLAVVGPNANATFQLLGDYSGWPCHGIVQPVYDAFSAAGFAVNFEFGCAINSTDTSGFPSAIAAAQTADATILVLGMDHSVEREGLDRYQIGWPGVQGQLATAVCAASRGPCILVVIAAGPIDFSAQLADANVDAILLAGYPGIAGAAAVVATVTGKNVPAGRLTKTVYPADYVNQVSNFEFAMPAGPSIWPPGTSPGRTYRFYTGTPVLPFGFGLSYTTFSYSVTGPARVSASAAYDFTSQFASSHMDALFAPLTSPVIAQYNVTVTNTGSIDADDAILGFLVPPGAGTDGLPLQYLFGFQRVHVPAGQSVSVWLGVTARDVTCIREGVPAGGSRFDAHETLPTGFTGHAYRDVCAGEYELRVGVPEGATGGAGFAHTRFVLG